MKQEALDRIKAYLQAGDDVELWTFTTIQRMAANHEFLKKALNTRKDLKSLLEAYEAMREAMNTILVASEFHSQQGLADYVMRYAHENNVRLIKQTLGVCEATERSEDNDE